MSNSLGERIVAARKRAGLSAATLADRVGVRPTQVWRWELKGTKPRTESLAKIAEVCGVSMESLIGRRKRAA